VVELPFGRGRRFAGSAGSTLDKVIGGWQAAGLFRVTSGRPFSVFAGANTFSSVVGSFANCNGCSPHDGDTHEEGGLVWYLFPEERARYSAPAAGQLGNTGRNFLRSDGFFNLDLSVSKRTSLSERFSLELRADFSNLTNTPSFGLPTTTFTDPTFGRIRATVSSFARQTMLGAKILF
jgi:hypothetical protein